MFGYGLGIGIVIGLAAGAALVRYGMGLGERMIYGARDGHPALSESDTPFEQVNTVGDVDEDVEL